MSSGQYHPVSLPLPFFSSLLQLINYISAVLMPLRHSTRSLCLGNGEIEAKRPDFANMVGHPSEEQPRSQKFVLPDLGTPFIHCAWRPGPPVSPVRTPVPAPDWQSLVHDTLPLQPLIFPNPLLPRGCVALRLPLTTALSPSMCLAGGWSRARGRATSLPAYTSPHFLHPPPSNSSH